jgi:hypothetical protein
MTGGAVVVVFWPPASPAQAPMKTEHRTASNGLRSIIESSPILVEE